jgi:exonuclease III
VSRKLARYKLDLVGVQEVRWNKRGTVRAEDYIFFYGKGNEKNQLGTGFFVHHGKVSPVKRVEFVTDRMSHIVLSWCNIIVLNVQAPSDESNDSFYEESEQIFDHFPKFRMKILPRDFNVKFGRHDFSNRQLEMRVYVMIVTIMVSE